MLLSYAISYPQPQNSPQLGYDLHLLRITYDITV